MKQKAREIFSPLMVLILVGVGLVTMIGSLLVASFMPNDGSRLTARANSFSPSAIGHKVLVESLEKQGIKPLISQYRTADRVQINSLLLLLEPTIQFKEKDQFRKLLTRSQVLVSLPKWTGRPDQINPRWLGRAYLAPVSYPLTVLKEIDPEAEIVRPFAFTKQKKNENKKVALEKEPDDKKAADKKVKDEPKKKNIVIGDISKSSLEDHELKRPITWTTNLLGYTPDLVNPQLIRSKKITPIVSSEEGILIGSMPGARTRIILSDPDILSNSGIGRGENAKLAFALLSLAMNGDSALIIDETSHGFIRDPDFFRAAFEYPFVFVTVQVLIFTAFLIWTTIQRFGKPQKAQKVHKTSKTVLIQNMASLLQRGDHQPEVLEKHIEFTWRAMARKLRAPRNLDDTSTIAWLDDLGRKKGVHMSLQTLRHRAKMLNGRRGGSSFLDAVHEKPLLQIILHLEQWEQEMLDGS